MKRWVFKLGEDWRQNPHPREIPDIGALVTCPECGSEASIVLERIRPNGDVAENLICRNDHCDFNYAVTLEGWDGES